MKTWRDALFGLVGVAVLAWPVFVVVFRRAATGEGSLILDALPGLLAWWTVLAVVGVFGAGTVALARKFRGWSPAGRGILVAAVLLFLFIEWGLFRMGNWIAAVIAAILAVAAALITLFSA